MFVIALPDPIKSRDENTAAKSAAEGTDDEKEDMLAAAMASMNT
jgi:hypothetical protein